MVQERTMQGPSSRRAYRDSQHVSSVFEAAAARKPLTQIAQAIEARPQAAFTFFLLLHFLLWTALPAALYPNLPLDLIEALTYGREWQLGYDKLPPLPWWLVELTHRVFGLDVFYYALAQTAVVAAFLFVWTMTRRIVGPVQALVAILIVDGLHYLHFTAAKFNHDVIQLPFWAMAGYCYWAALRGGRLIHWLMLGLALGIALWAKYFVVVLAFPLVLFLLIDKRARRHLLTPGPYAAAALALLVASPHIVWLIQNDFLPFRYADARAAPSRGMIDHVWHPLQFALGQLFFLLPALLIAFAAAWPWSSGGEAAPGIADAYDRRIVTVLAVGPVATVLALSLITGRGAIAMWGYPLWLFLGLWIVMQAPIAGERLGRAAMAWAAVFWLFAVVFFASYAVMPSFDGRYRAVFFPGDRLGAELSQRFRAATGQPLAYVVADMFTGGNVAHYAPGRPRNLIDGEPRRAPWIDLQDLRKRGAVVVWTEEDTAHIPARLSTVTAGAQVQQPFSLPYRRGKGEARFGWAILRPQ
jgi:hypothetical protein